MRKPLIAAFAATALLVSAPSAMADVWSNIINSATLTQVGDNLADAENNNAQNSTTSATAGAGLVAISVADTSTGGLMGNLNSDINVNHTVNHTGNNTADANHSNGSGSVVSAQAAVGAVSLTTTQSSN